MERLAYYPDDAATTFPKPWEVAIQMREIRARLRFCPAVEAPGSLESARQELAEFRDASRSRGAVRISFIRFSTDEDIDSALEDKGKVPASKRPAASMTDNDDFFIDLMYSLDAAFLALQGVGAWHPEGWGERFFQELTLNYPEWSDRKLPIYMKACEILNYFAFLGRTEEMGPAFYDKPESLLRMVLMVLHHCQSNPTAMGRRPETPGRPGE